MDLTVNQALQNAVAAHKAGRLQEAEAIYLDILQIQPKQPDANHNLGILNVSLDKLELALPLFKIALEAYPNQGQFWISYVDALIKANQLGIAENVIKQGKIFGLVSERFDDLEMQLKQKKFLQQPESLLQNQPSSFTQKRKKMSAKKEKKQNASLNQVCTPSQIDVNVLLESYRKGRYDLAETFAKNICLKYPDYQLSWKVLSAVFKQTGRIHESLVANQKAIELVRNDAEAHYELGITLQELFRLSDAVESYKKAIVIKPKYAEAHYNLGNTLKELGKLEDAEASYKKAIAVKPYYAKAHYNLGITLQELARLVDAEASYRKAISIKPELAEAHYNLGITMQELARLEDAEASYRKAISIKPELAEAHSNLGNTLQELGRLQDAEACYVKAIEIKPEYPEAHCNLGNILQEFGKLEEAELCYKKAIALEPYFLEAVSNLSLTLLFLDKLDDAIQVLLKIITIDPEGYGLKACVDLAILNFLNDDPSSSKSLLLKSINISNNKNYRFKNEVAYWNHLSKLLTEQKNETLKEIDKLEIQKIYVIGESHCLASHGTYIKLNQSHYVCQSFWIVGCKQWHLGNILENKYKHKFHKIIQCIPSSSNILLSIGEIDCRLDDGILIHIKKYPTKSRSELINSTINDYLKYIFKLIFQFSYKVTIQGVPCPNISIDNQNKEEISVLVDLIKEFNIILKNQAHFYKFNFLNIHKLTDRGDGFSNEKWHLDQYHLSPAGMQEAWRTCFDEAPNSNTNLILA
jgi:tetratricopeptide (TPR) repeat protein